MCLQDIVDTKLLFGNMEELLDVAQRFLQELERHTSEDGGQEAQLADCFTDMREELAAVYANYCRNHDEACDMLIKVSESNDIVIKVCDKVSDW